MRRRRRTVVVGPVWANAKVPGALEGQERFASSGLESIAAKKGRVIVWPSVRRIERRTVTGDFLVWLVTETAPKPDWKRKAVTQ